MESFTRQMFTVRCTRWFHSKESFGYKLSFLSKLLRTSLKCFSSPVLEPDRLTVTVKFSESSVWSFRFWLVHIFLPLLLCSFETKFCLVYFRNSVSTKQCVDPHLRLASLDNLTVGRPPRPPRSPRQARKGDRVFKVWLSPTHHIGCVIHASQSKDFWHKDGTVVWITDHLLRSKVSFLEVLWNIK